MSPSRETLASTLDAPVTLPAPSTVSRLRGKRVGMVVFSPYPSDPRPRRAAEALLKEGMIVDLICEAEEKSPKRQVVNGLEIIRIPIRHRRGGVPSYAYQYAAFTLISAVILAWRSLRNRYDLVYVHNMPDVLVLSACVPKLLGAKVILDQHDPMPELMTTIFGLGEKSFGIRMIRLLERWSIWFADLVITVNIACKRLFSERSCRLEKVGIVMNSPDEEIFPYRAADSYPNRRPGQRFAIMYHGSLVERNGLDVAVEALAQLRETVPAAELWVYGRHTAFLEEVMNNVRLLGLQDCVHYCGPKKLEELVHEIETCDVGVIPNQRNAFTDINTPTRIFEYLALGKPVIAPSTLGIQDYFGEGSLFFFESGNSKQLARELELAYSDPDHAREIASRGQKIYLKHRWQEERQSLIDLVSGLLVADKPCSSREQFPSIA